MARRPTVRSPAPPIRPPAPTPPQRNFALDYARQLRPTQAGLTPGGRAPLQNQNLRGTGPIGQTGNASLAGARGGVSFQPERFSRGPADYGDPSFRPPGGVMGLEQQTYRPPFANPQAPAPVSPRPYNLDYGMDYGQLPQPRPYDFRYGMDYGQLPPRAGPGYVNSQLPRAQTSAYMQGRQREDAVMRAKAYAPQPDFSQYETDTGFGGGGGSDFDGFGGYGGGGFGDFDNKPPDWWTGMMTWRF